MRRHLRGAMMTAIESDDSGTIMERRRRDCPLDCHGTQEPPQIGYRDMIPCPCSHNQRLFRVQGQKIPRHLGTSRIPTHEEWLNIKDFRRYPQCGQQRMIGKPVPEERKTPTHATGTRKPAPVRHDSTISRYRDKIDCPDTTQTHDSPLQRHEILSPYATTTHSPATETRTTVPVHHDGTFSSYRDKNTAAALSRYSTKAHFPGTGTRRPFPCTPQRRNSPLQGQRLRIKELLRHETVPTAMFPVATTQATIPSSTVLPSPDQTVCKRCNSSGIPSLSRAAARWPRRDTRRNTQHRPRRREETRKTKKPGGGSRRVREKREEGFSYGVRKPRHRNELHPLTFSI